MNIPTQIGRVLATQMFELRSRVHPSHSRKQIRLSRTELAAALTIAAQRALRAEEYMEPSTTQMQPGNRAGPGRGR